MSQPCTHRRSATHMALALALGLALFISRPVAAETTQAATIAGHVVDESGGVIPGANVTIKGAAGTTNQAVTNATGRFTFKDLPAGQYGLTTTLPGFKTARASLTVAAGETAEPLVTLSIGALSEQITVTCSTPSPLNTLSRLFGALVPTLHAEAAQGPIRVGGNVRVPKRTNYVQPACPGIDSAAVTVVMSGTVDATGKVTGVELAPGVQAPRNLVEGATDAISQWVYTPTMLNGKPVAVEITVTVHFVKR